MLLSLFCSPKYIIIIILRAECILYTLLLLLNLTLFFISQPVWYISPNQLMNMYFSLISIHPDQASSKASSLNAEHNELQSEWLHMPTTIYSLIFSSRIAPPSFCQKHILLLSLIHHKLFYIFLPTVALFIRLSGCFLICRLFLKEMYLYWWLQLPGRVHK